jgi:deoxyribose-phosphate aldolase
MSSRNSAIDRKALAQDPRSLAAIIDHTMLRPEATREQIVQLCAEAREHKFGAVVINPCYVPLAVSELRGQEVKVGAVIGFPFGATLTSVKIFEAMECIKLGAVEIDMVINLGFLKGGDKEGVLADIKAVTEAVHFRHGLLKVILETGLLTNDEKLLACQLVEKAGADFVKTSTGFLAGGATVEDVKLMRGTVSIGVKASGGIRSYGDAVAMIEAGADRLGTSSGVKIVTDMRTPSQTATPSTGY